MKELLDKLSSYNIFNYLFPGVIFSVLAAKFTSINLIQDNLVLGAFVYYFIGLVISRLGSLIIEPVLKCIKFVEFAGHARFVKAVKIDPKIDVLSEVNNMYRTLCALFLSLIFLKIYSLIEANYSWLQGGREYILLVFLFAIFLFAYRKQTNYVTSRVNANLKD